MEQTSGFLMKPKTESYHKSNLMTLVYTNYYTLSNSTAHREKPYRTSNRKEVSRIFRVHRILIMRPLKSN